MLHGWIGIYLLVAQAAAACQMCVRQASQSASPLPHPFCMVSAQLPVSSPAPCAEHGCAVVLLQSLDVFLAGDDVAKLKPDPCIYLTAAGKLGVEPSQCLVVEDSIVGLKVTPIQHPKHVSLQ